MVKRFGKKFMLGPTGVMATEQLFRIVDCAAAGKLDDAGAFRRQVRWKFSDNDARVQAILDLVEADYPDQSQGKVKKNSGQETSTVSSPTLRPIVTPRKCGTCGSTEHIGEYRTLVLSSAVV